MDKEATVPAPALRAEFLDAVNGADVLASILRTHKILDLLAAKAVAEYLPEASGAEVGTQASFILKVDLLIAFSALTSTLRPVFLKLNSIRNRFAHEHRASFELQDGRDLFNLIPAEYRSAFGKEDRSNPLYVLTRTAGLLYAQLEGALERSRDDKVAHQVLQQMIEKVLVPEEQWSESVRLGEAQLQAEIAAHVLAEKLRRREAGDV